ncbi:MAG TPA: alpha/beta hydrolase [Candidatus Udaeobacter sp.]|nr:alpha/beta hydrolase [Candidatus Udaeobacter sp.]
MHRLRIHPFSLRLIVCAFSAACIGAAIAGESETGTADDCRTGVHRFSDGEIVDIARSEGNTFRWRKFDGTTGVLHKKPDDSWTSTLGWTDHPDGHSVSFTRCAMGEIEFDGKKAHRIAFDVTDTVFEGRGGVKLAGRLVLPKGNDPVPIVVLVHGAERESARESYALQRLLPAENVGAFVYDKRGTGASEGKYTQDFDTLADDAVAAMREARRIAGMRCARVGYQGGSQGGWVAPLAATRAPVDFLIVSFGLAVSVIDEDQEEVALEMHLKGHSQEEISKALEVASAAEAVFESGFTKGFERFDAARAKYRNEPWYKDLHGNYTHFILPYTTAEIREKGKDFVFGTPFRYDPMPTLRAVEVPQLWILGEDDLEAPSAETSRRIKTLIAEGKPITLALFPHAEHGMTEYEVASNGERLSTRYAPGYFAMMRDFARSGRLSGSYGSSVVARPVVIASGAQRSRGISNY